MNMSTTKILRAGIITALFMILGITQASAAKYRIDPTHGFVEFTISHMGFSLVGGRFDKFAGNLVWDKNNPSASSIEVRIDVTSVDTNNKQRDEDISGPAYLNVAKFPRATFKSTMYKGDANGGKLMGNFTLNGVTRMITIDIKRLGEGKDPWGGYRVGFSGETKINGADYGYKNPLVKQPIHIYLSVEGIRQK